MLERYPPDIESKRQMLTNAREQYRAKGFEAELNVEAMKVQVVPGEDGAKKVAAQIAEHENTARNAYASARRMDELLAKLPKPKKEK